MEKGGVLDILKETKVDCVIRGDMLQGKKFEKCHSDEMIVAKGEI